jgi:GTP-binding protein
MNFVDKVEISVVAGKGGNGKMSFHREKFVAKGGPDGGDGGNGGNIVLVASRNQNTLAKFRFQKELRAGNGDDGRSNRQHGKNGVDLLVDVPVGTIVLRGGAPVVDLTDDGQEAIIARGGKGGFGNAHFVSSVRQAPKFAEKGEPGEAFTIQLEMKMIADVGLVGLPNAGKSTLLARISNARPEIADYPFTTLVPNLGVVDIGDTSLLFADIPGLIEGASHGKGLGHEFLRHIERTAVILHLIDAYQDDVAKAYETVTTELKSHDEALLNRPQIVVLNKVEGLDEEIVDDLMSKLRQVVPRDTPLLAISTQAGTGIDNLLFTAKSAVEAARQQAAAVPEPEDAVPIHRLSEGSDAWHIEKSEDAFAVSGEAIEHFAARTDFSNEEALQRLRDIMQKQGIMHELVRLGIQPGQQILFPSGKSFEY